MMDLLMDDNDDLAVSAQERVVMEFGAKEGDSIPSFEEEEEEAQVYVEAE